MAPVAVVVVGGVDGGDVVGSAGGRAGEVFDLPQATTAKPVAAWSARAASMLALRAGRVVWEVTAVMSWTTSPVRALDCPS